MRKLRHRADQKLALVSGLANELSGFPSQERAYLNMCVPLKVLLMHHFFIAIAKRKYDIQNNNLFSINDVSFLSMF